MTVVVHAIKQRTKKLLRHVEFIDRSVTNRPMDFSIVRFTAEQLQGLRPNGQNLATEFVQGQHRWLVQDNALTGRINYCVHGAEIYRQIVGKESTQDVHDNYPPKHTC